MTGHLADLAVAQSTVQAHGKSIGELVQRVEALEASIATLVQRSADLRTAVQAMADRLDRVLVALGVVE